MDHPYMDQPYSLVPRETSLGVVLLYRVQMILQIDALGKTQ